MAAHKIGKLAAASTALEADASGMLPSEFPIFTPGEVASDQGKYLFDAKDLADVLAAYNHSGVDLMVDLEHDSVDETKRALRANAADALGWYKIEATPEGGLKACGAKWCPEGARRLAEKTQRYISPLFEYDDQRHIKRLINVALVARPATLHAQPLMAASKHEGSKMNPELIKKALDALIAGDANAALEILKDLVSSAAGAATEPAETPEPAEPAVDALAETAATPPVDEEDKMIAAALRKATGRVSSGETIAALRSMVATSEAVKQANARAELSSRLELVGDLVKLGAERPSTAWEGDPDERKPVARLSAEPIESLRYRVAQLRAFRPEGDEALKPPVAALSAVDEARAQSIKDPDHRARFIERRLGRA